LARAGRAKESVKLSDSIPEDTIDKDKTVIEKFKDTVKEIVDLAAAASMKAMEPDPDQVAVSAGGPVYIPEATGTAAIPVPVIAATRKPPVKYPAKIAGVKKKAVAKRTKKTVTEKAKKAASKKKAAKTLNHAAKKTAKKATRKKKTKKSER
jgi:hypothetical protein